MGYVYFVQPREYIRSDIYKIGMSSGKGLSRLQSYGGGTRNICLFECNDYKIVERQLINQFNDTYTLVRGFEYFKISDELQALQLFTSIVIDYKISGKNNISETMDSEDEDIDNASDNTSDSDIVQLFKSELTIESNKPSFNLIDIDLTKNENVEAMNVNDFIDTFKYDIDKKYFNILWSSMCHKHWIVVDYDMLRWLGYTCYRARDNKRKFIKLAREYLIEGNDFDISGGNDSRLKDTSLKLRKNTVIISYPAFKKILLKIHTTQGPMFKNLHGMIETIHNDYSRYISIIDKHNMEVSKSNPNS